MRTLSIIALVAMLAFAPSLAAACDPHGHCGGPEPHIVVVAEFEADGATWYVVDDHGAVQLWKETNGLLEHGQPRAISGEETGLQIVDVCLHGDEVEYIDADECEAEGGVVVAPDFRVTNGWILQQIVGTLP